MPKRVFVDPVFQKCSSFFVEHQTWIIFSVIFTVIKEETLQYFGAAFLGNVPHTILIIVYKLKEKKSINYI